MLSRGVTSVKLQPALRTKWKGLEDGSSHGQWFILKWSVKWLHKAYLHIWSSKKKRRMLLVQFRNLGNHLANPFLHLFWGGRNHFRSDLEIDPQIFFSLSGPPYFCDNFSQFELMDSWCIQDWTYESQSTALTFMAPAASSLCVIKGVINRGCLISLKRLLNPLKVFCI